MLVRKGGDPHIPISSPQDLVHGPAADKEVASEMISKIQKSASVWETDKIFEAVYHTPRGEFRDQPNLMYGPGQQAKRGCLYEKRFRKCRVCWKLFFLLGVR